MSDKIQFNCPSCGTNYRVPTAAVGKKVDCQSCGKSMTIPATSSASAASQSSSYRQASAAGMSAADEPVAAVPAFGDAGSAFGASQRRSSISPMLLIAGIGGAAVLLLVGVLVIVILGSGESDPGETTATPPAPRVERARRGRGGNTDEDPTADATEDGSTEVTPIIPVVARQDFRKPSNNNELTNWTLQATPAAQQLGQKAELCGMAFYFPREWAVVNSATLENATSNRGVVSGLSADATISMEINVYRPEAGPVGDWPNMYKVGMITPEMFGNLFEDDFDYINGEDNLDWVFAYEDDEPRYFCVRESAYQSLDYGTLFDGYRFVRVVLQNRQNDIEKVAYIGYMEDLLVVAVAQVPSGQRSRLADIEWVIRSAHLLEKNDAQVYAQDDPLYRSWFYEPDVSLPHGEDRGPVSGLVAAGWDGFSDGSSFADLTALALVGPRNQDYVMFGPEGMPHVSTTRLAVRWLPNEDTGLWMEMKTTKLSGASRRIDSPIIETEQGEDPKALLYGREVDLPQGYEYSTIETNELTVHRILMPAVDSSSLRQIYYVVIDHGQEITIVGYFDNDRPEDLERLEEAVSTLQKRED